MDPATPTERVTIIPTVLANTAADFTTRLARLLPISRELQIDIMDGDFVPSTSVEIERIPDLGKHVMKDKEGIPLHTFEAHLMVRTPGAYIQPLARRGCTRMIIHVETVTFAQAKNLLATCEKHGCSAILAINPETPIERLDPYLPLFPTILFLGVHPGFNGAPYVRETPGRIAALIARNGRGFPGASNPALVVQVDGGMTPETVGGVVRAGARRINSGSFVSNAADPALALASMQAAANAALLHAPTKRRVVLGRRPVRASIAQHDAAKPVLKKRVASRRTKRKSSPTRRPGTTARRKTARRARVAR